MNKAIIFSLEGILSFTLLITFITLLYTSEFNLQHSNSIPILLRLSRAALDIGEFSELYNNSTTPEDIGYCSSGDITGSSEILTYPDPNSYSDSTNNSYWLTANPDFKRYNASLCFSREHISPTRIISIQVPDPALSGVSFQMNASVLSSLAQNLTLTLNSSLLNSSQTISCLQGLNTFSFSLNPTQAETCYELNLTLNSSSILDFKRDMVCTKIDTVSKRVSIPEYPSLIPFVIFMIMVVKYG